MRLPDGAWIVRDWRIRVPQYESTPRRLPRRTGYIEEGGVVWAITDSAGQRILHAETASISGVVTDSAGTGPPTDLVVVELVETGAQTIPNSDGSFLLTGLDEGRHLLRVRRPLHSSWGIAGRNRPCPPSCARHRGRAGRRMRRGSPSRRHGRLHGPYHHPRRHRGGRYGRLGAVAARVVLLPGTHRGALRPRRHPLPRVDVRTRRPLRHRHDNHRLAGGSSYSATSPRARACGCGWQRRWLMIPC